MGVIYNEKVVQEPDLWNYKPEYNEDGSEKHISCNGARYHVLSWGMKNGHSYQRCSEPNCEINHRQKLRDEENKKNPVYQPAIDVKF